VLPGQWPIVAVQAVGLRWSRMARSREPGLIVSQISPNVPYGSQPTGANRAGTLRGNRDLFGVNNTGTVDGVAPSRIQPILTGDGAFRGLQCVSVT
jgi:hypothetical protein